MASYTRFYPTVKAPHFGRYDGKAEGDWDAGFIRPPWYHPQWAFLASPSKTNGGVATTRTFKTNQQGNYDILVYCWLIGPLTAQTISGDFNMTFWPSARWLSPSPTSPTNDSIVRYKLHMYVTQGYTTTVRGTLLNNHVDIGAFQMPDSGFDGWTLMGADATLSSVAAQAGDYIRIEFGVRVESSPIQTPNYFPTETWATDIRFVNLTGTTNSSNVAHTDATTGTSTSRAAHFDFTSAIEIDETAVAAPAHDACADAEVIPSLPWESDRIDTAGSTGTQKEVWYKYTAATNGVVFVTTMGSTYGIDISVLSGSCAGSATGVNAHALAPQRGLTVYRFTAVQGTDYFVRVRNRTLSQNAVDSGGSLTLQMFYRETPQEDDLYLPCISIGQFRDGRLVNVSNDFAGSLPTGVIIDYSGTAMDSFSGGQHTGERLLVGLHDFDIVEILDLPTFSIGGPEIDFIADPWNAPGAITIHPATMAIDRMNNHLYTGFFGNGYLLVIGEGAVISSRPAVLNTVSNDTAYSAIKRLAPTNGDSQPGAPFTDILLTPTVEVTAPWAITMDEANGDIYFTSGGFYYPVGGQSVYKYNIGTGLTTTFATLPVRSGNNPGLKGLQFLPGGGLLVCNADVVHRLNSAGSTVGTYTPSVPLESQNLGDVKLTADGTQFWTVDIPTARLFLVNIATMTEVATYPTYLGVGVLVQMAIYQPDGAGVPPTSEAASVSLEDCPDILLEDAPGKPLPHFLRTHGYTKQGPAASGSFDLDSAPGKGFTGRFKG